MNDLTMAMSMMYKWHIIKVKATGGFMNKVLKLVVLSLLIMSVVACSATPTRRAFKEGWRDSNITSKVKWKMGRDELVKAHNIDVDTWRGVVTLTGRATSAEEKTQAEIIAKNVKNVSGVKNYIEVVEPVSISQKVAKENIPFQKPTGKYAKPQDIRIPAISKNANTSTAKTSATTTTTTSSVSETDLAEKHQDSITYDISKELADTSSLEAKEPETSDVTLQAEQELKELKAKKKSK